MDFGAALLNRFERTFGRKLVVFLEGVMVLTLLCICFGGIWTFMGPIVTTAYQTVLPSLPTFTSTGYSRGSLLFLFPIFIGAFAFAMWSAWWLIRERRRLEKEYIKLVTSHEAAIECIDDLMAQQQEIEMNVEGKQNQHQTTVENIRRFGERIGEVVDKIGPLVL